jgi:hypothetical protein
MEPVAARQGQISARATVLRTLNQLHRQIGLLLNELEDQTIEESGPLSVWEDLDSMRNDLGLASAAACRWTHMTEMVNRA